MGNKYLDKTGLTRFWSDIKSKLQVKLVSGTNIKTVNSTSLLGSGNISTVPSAGSITGVTNSATSVGTAKIALDTIGTPNLRDSAVSSAKIADSAVTAGKIGSSAVTTAKINDAAVTTAKLASTSVTAAKIDFSTFILKGTATVEYQAQGSAGGFVGVSFGKTLSKVPVVIAQDAAADGATSSLTVTGVSTTGFNLLARTAYPNSSGNITVNWIAFVI